MKEKNTFKSFILALIAVLLPQLASAYDIMANGLCYNFNTDSTNVTLTSGGNYTDAVIIPSDVKCGDTTYTVTAIGDKAFNDCVDLTAVIIPNTVVSIGDSAFMNCSGLTSVAIPSSVTAMGNDVFYGCSSLQSMLLFGTNCDYFTSGASSVQSLFLAPSVTSIKGLGVSPSQVYCYGAVPPVCDDSTFNGYSGTLHVPNQGLAPYLADDYWGNFNSIYDDAVWADNVAITLSEDSVSLMIGDTAQLTASLDTVPTGITTQWFSTNSSVVEVTDGVLTAKAVGEADVVAMCGEHFAICHVTVEDEIVTIELDYTSLTLNMDETAIITPSHTPSTIPLDYTFTCSGSNVVLAEWEDGVIKLLATKPGIAVITVSSSDGNAVPAICEVTVNRPFGDVNVDGRVTTSDVTCIYNYLLNDDDTYLATSDVNGDGFITSTDITILYDILMNNPSTDIEYDYVDLGLPSGTLWATMNIGASSPEDNGYYFAWGETQPKESYDLSTYQWCNGTTKTITKYCTKISYGYNGFVDNKTELDPEDDAATVNWGPEWRMPTIEQMQELKDNCSSEWTTRNGVYGRLLTSNHNGVTLFFPAAGYYYGSDLIGGEVYGNYWSRMLNTSSPDYAFYMTFKSDYLAFGICPRQYGFSVRAVRVPLK